VECYLLEPGGAGHLDNSISLFNRNKTTTNSTLRSTECLHGVGMANSRSDDETVSRQSAETVACLSINVVIALRRGHSNDVSCMCTAEHERPCDGATHIQGGPKK